MILAYLLALLPLAFGCVLWITSKKIVFAEWITSTVVAFITAGIFHIVAIAGMTDDTETWSGQISKTVYEPEWVEKYKEAVYKDVTKTRTVGSGKSRHTETYTERVFSHYETRYRTHPDDWTAYVNYGTETNIGYDITKKYYDEVRMLFGNKIEPSTPSKSGFYSGDPHIYTVRNQSGIIIPAHMTKGFENRVKAAPSVFSYTQVPPNAPVYPYPVINDWRASNRVLGVAGSLFGNKEWDILNSKLGPQKKVNLIVVGFASMDSQLGQLQEAKWIGGKKNDLVLTYGWNGSKIVWSYVFGWTEQEIVKRNLETILLQQPTISKIEDEVRANYKIKDWHKFDYISVEPPVWSYLVLVIVMACVQVGFWVFAFKNDIDKD